MIESIIDSLERRILNLLITRSHESWYASNIAAEIDIDRAYCSKILKKLCNGSLVEVAGKIGRAVLYAAVSKESASMSKESASMSKESTSMSKNSLMNHEFMIHEFHEINLRKKSFFSKISNFGESQASAVAETMPASAVVDQPGPVAPDVDVPSAVERFQRQVFDETRCEYLDCMQDFLGTYPMEYFDPTLLVPKSKWEFFQEAQRAIFEKLWSTPDVVNKLHFPHRQTFESVIHVAAFSFAAELEGFRGGEDEEGKYITGTEVLHRKIDDWIARYNEHEKLACRYARLLPWQVNISTESNLSK